MSIIFLLLPTLITSFLKTSLFEDNKLPFIRHINNKNLKIDIFNHVSYMTMSRSSYSPSQNQLINVFQTIFGHINEMTSTNQFLMLIKRIKIGICYKHFIVEYLIYKGIRCSVFTRLELIHSIKDLDEFEGKCKNNLIFIPLSKVHSIYGQVKFHFLSKFDLGSIFVTIFNIKYISFFGIMTKIISFLNYKEGRYIEGGMGKFAYNNRKIDIIYNMDLLQFGFTMDVAISYK